MPSASDQLDAWVTETCTSQRCHRADFRFLARDARAVAGLGPTQVKLHLHRLVDLEYVLVHRAPRGHGVSYELVYEGGAGADHTTDAAIFSGLRSVETLAYDAERSAPNGERSGLGRPPVGGRPGGGRTDQIASIARADSELVAAASARAENAVNGARRRSRHTVVEGGA